MTAQRRAAADLRPDPPQTPAEPDLVLSVLHTLRSHQAAPVLQHDVWTPP